MHFYAYKYAKYAILP